MVIGKLAVVLGLHSAQFATGMRQVGAHVRTFRGDVRGSVTTLSTLATTMARVTVAAAAMHAAMALARPAQQFDQAMANSTAIMRGLTQTMRQDMEQTAKEVATVTKFSAAETAGAYYYLASAGMDAAQSMAALPQVARFAQAGNFDLATATDLATDAQSALGLVSQNAAQNLANLTRVTDVLVMANTLANASTQQFSEALTTKSGAALRALGKDIEEGVAVLAAFADQGVKGSEAGTQFAIVLRDLQTKAIENEAAFAANKVAVFDSSGEMRNMADILGDLEGRLGGMSDKMQKATLLQMGFSDKSVGALQTLLGMSEKIREYEANLKNAAGTTQNVANKQLPLFAQGLDRVKSILGRISISAFKPVLDALGTALLAVAPILEFVAQTLEAMVRAFAWWFDGLKEVAMLFEQFTGDAQMAGEAMGEAAPKAQAMAGAAEQLNSIVGETPAAMAAAKSAVDEFMNSLAQEIRFTGVGDLEKQLELMKEKGEFQTTTTQTVKAPRVEDISGGNALLEASKERVTAMQSEIDELNRYWFAWNRNGPVEERENRITEELEYQKKLTDEIRKARSHTETVTTETFDADKYRRVRDAMLEVLEVRRQDAEFRERQQEFDAMRSAGQSVKDALATPLEKFKKRIEDANRMVEMGAIGWQTYTREIAAARAELVRLQAQASGPALLEEGTQHFYAAMATWERQNKAIAAMPDVPMPDNGPGPASSRRPAQEEMIWEQPETMIWEPDKFEWSPDQEEMIWETPKPPEVPVMPAPAMATIQPPTPVETMTMPAPPVRNRRVMNEPAEPATGDRQALPGRDRGEENKEMVAELKAVREAIDSLGAAQGPIEKYMQRTAAAVETIEMPAVAEF